MIEQQPLRTQLGEILRTEVSDVLWQYWLEQGYIQGMLTGRLSFNEAILELNRALYAHAFPRGELPMRWGLPPKSPAELDISVRDARFEELVAREAQDDPDVRAFRHGVLRGRLIKGYTAITNWLRIREAKEQPFDLWVGEVRMNRADRQALYDAIQATAEPPSSDEPRTEQSFTLTTHLPPGQFPWQISLHVLHCRLGRSNLVYYAPVADGGVLDRLRRLAEYLAPRYGWDEADAADFVLTGLPQPAPRIRSEVTLVDHLPVMSRITLSIDPSMKPSEVARYFDEIRSEITSIRPRELSEKHAELARFTAARPEGETELQRMEAWNHQYPQWAYEQQANFVRDAAQAKKRLLYPEYHAPAEVSRPRNFRHIRRSEDDHGQTGQ